VIEGDFLSGANHDLLLLTAIAPHLLLHLLVHGTVLIVAVGIAPVTSSLLVQHPVGTLCLSIPPEELILVCVSSEELPLLLGAHPVHAGVGTTLAESACPTESSCLAPGTTTTSTSQVASESASAAPETATAPSEGSTTATAKVAPATAAAKTPTSAATATTKLCL
jgi:hypothetical protein